MSFTQPLNPHHPLGTMTITEETIFTSGGSQTGLSRWGDYSQMSIDPVDDQTFWYSHEYIPSTGSFNWRTRIASFTFGAPCPVGFPSNPNPADGATDVPITLAQLSWTNGAGANQNELWFGEAGSMALVHSGSLISSWPIPSNLSYNTSYEWRVVEMNDTCSTIGSVWSFTTEQNPDIVIDTLLFDDFESGLGLWTIVNNGGTCDWMIFNPPYPNPYTLPGSSSGGVLSSRYRLACRRTQNLRLSTQGILGPDDGAASRPGGGVGNPHLELLRTGATRVVA